MGDEMWISLIEDVRKAGVEFDVGLTDSEVAAAESRYGFTFPPDLRAFLQTAIPCGKGFPDWRSGDKATLRDWLDWPRQGILFDVEHNGFWLDEWGSRPASLEEAQHIVNGLVADAPKLIPIYIHRMMPSEPHLPRNPVFSVHQTDIIHYGIDLRDYFIREFLDSQGCVLIPDTIRGIRFWNIDKFQSMRWSPDESCKFDNRGGILP
jgi:hypothetical protein